MIFTQTTNIIKDEKLLSINYIPENIVDRTKEIENIAFNFSFFFREHPTLPKFTIYGSVGVGKTAVLNYVLKKFQEEAKKQKPDLKLKIVSIKGSESNTKYSIMKKILNELEPNFNLLSTTSKSDIYDIIKDILARKGFYLLIIIDEIHSISKSDLDSVIYTITRFGEDLNYYTPKPSLEEPVKSEIGYIFVSNDFNLRNKLETNTNSTFTIDREFFARYDSIQITKILLDRYEQGALFENTIEEGVLELISALSIKEGEDARYALILLTHVARDAERRNMLKITKDLVNEVNEDVRKDFLKKVINTMSSTHLEILKEIFYMSANDETINSKTIYKRFYDLNKRKDYSRISQIVTDLEKNNIVYVTSSKSSKLRNLSIEENIEEIKNALEERGMV